LPRCSRRASRSSTCSAIRPFQASGIEGIKVRITAKAADDDAAEAILAAEEASLRTLLGDYVFGVDGQTMESVVIGMLRERDLSLAVAESVTGGLVGARLTGVAGIGDVLRGGLVAYASDIKFKLLGVPEGPVVCLEAAAAMAAGVRKLLDADVGLATTGVAGPEEQDGQPVGTVFLGLAIGDQLDSTIVRLPGDPNRIREYGVISLLNFLRLRLLAPVAG
jgi:nicotinamide-nucleotide amidase